MSTTASTTSTTATLAPTQFYDWNGYRCAYEHHLPPTEPAGVPLLLLHPIGVGLSRAFWHRFCAEWYQIGQRNPIYNPDLLGCGESDMPPVAYHPIDWARQLQGFLQTVVKTPVVLVVQGALFPVAVELVQLQPDLIRGLVLSGSPAWKLMTQATPAWKQRLRWNLFDSPLGNAFYRYARREQFLRSFSTRQLFADPNAVDQNWLTTLQQGSQTMDSRHAVFSFLAGFWRQDYRAAIAQITQPTLVAMGEFASTISRDVQQETPDQRLADYLACLPNSQGIKVPGRNIMPYEETPTFVRAIVPFVQQLGTQG